MSNKVERIKKIEKSFKFPDYCFVQSSVTDKLYKRKVYNKEGKTLVVFEYEVYSFEWASDDNKSLAKNIKWEYTLKNKDENGLEEKVQPQVPTEKPQVIEIPDGEVKHEKYEQIKVCIENNIPVYLVGPAGSGKNHTLEQIANELDLEFYFTNSVQQEYKLTGFIDAGGKFHETEFYKAFVNGGLFFLDEMDASIPEVLVLLNAAIANGYFEFPNGKVRAHKDFRVVSAGNTVGNGADEQYTGRLVLDQATLDRFAIIHFDYSRKVELALAKGNIELVEFIHSLRDQAKEKGIRATFSYRCITMVTKLENKLELTEIMGMAIFKGMDKDTINTFLLESANKYEKALKKIQR